MSRALPACLVALLLAAEPAVAQHHSGHGMTMPPSKAKTAPKPARKRATPVKPRPKPVTKQAAPVRPSDHDMTDHGAMDHSGMDHDMPPAQAADPHAGHVTPMPTEAPSGTDLPAGNAPPPPAPLPHYADRYWDKAAMARSRDIMMRDDGGGRNFAQVVVNLAEVEARDGREGFHWDGEGWFGGDIHRLAVKSEGTGTLGRKVGSAEAQLLYARAIGPYFNLQAGVRHDFAPSPGRTYASVGVEGLAPYWFDVEATVFLSTRGELLGRVEAYYDQRITQRLILQPRMEANLSAQGVRRIGIGTGITDADLGLRLRYEIRREFAPYVGLSWERKLGETARLARAANEDRGGLSFVAGIRGWF